MNLLHLELLEMILQKAVFSLSVTLWKTTSRPEVQVYTTLTSVCQTWVLTITVRKWFRRTVRRRLDSKYLCVPHLTTGIHCPEVVETDSPATS